MGAENHEGTTRNEDNSRALNLPEEMQTDTQGKGENRRETVYEIKIVNRKRRIMHNRVDKSMSY